MYTFHDVFVPYVTRTDVLGSCVCLPGRMSLNHMYTVLTRTYVFGSYVYCTYKDLCPWTICILTRTYALGSSVYLPEPMSLDHMYTYQDLRIWIMCILARTYVFGSCVYLPGLLSLDHMYTYQDLGPWKNNIYTSTRQSHTQTKNNEEKYAQTGRNCSKKMLDTEIGELQIV